MNTKNTNKISLNSNECLSIKNISNLTKYYSDNLYKSKSNKFDDDIKQLKKIGYKYGFNKDKVYD